MKTFRQALQSEHFTISADLTLQRESTVRDILLQADTLAGLVDGFQVSDNPYAWVQMSALSAAGILIDHGIDAIPILTCRDRNRFALESDLLGLLALGVSSVVLMRGHKAPSKHAVKASPVFDISARELIALAAGLGGDPSAPDGGGFFIGTGVRAFRPNRGWRAESLSARAAAGARFIQTQLCFNMEILRHYMKRFMTARPRLEFSVVVSLTPLPSAMTARWLKKNLSDSRIPDPIVDRLEHAANPEQEGIDICAGLMQEIATIPGVAGVNLMTMGNPQNIAAAIEASGLRS